MLLRKILELVYAIFQDMKPNEKMCKNVHHWHANQHTKVLNNMDSILHEVIGDVSIRQHYSGDFHHVIWHDQLQKLHVGHTSCVTVSQPSTHTQEVKKYTFLCKVKCNKCMCVCTMHV